MRILFIGWTRIGDAVLSTGILSHLIEVYPGAAVTVACGPLPAPLFEAAPGVERVIAMAKQPLHGHWVALWRVCRGVRWDLIVDLRASAVTWLVPARRRAVNWRPWATGHVVVQLAQLLGLGTPPAPRLWLPPRALKEAASLLPRSPVLALGPTASWRGKEWPLERFSELAERITSDRGLLPGACVAIFAAGPERHRIEPLLRAVPPERLIDLAGGVDLLTAAACLARCSLFVGNDSGPMHLAAAAGVPTIGLFGPTSEARYGPWGEHCTAVRVDASIADLPTRTAFERYGTATMMDGLAVETVEVAIGQLWATLAHRA